MSALSTLDEDELFLALGENLLAANHMGVGVLPSQKLAFGREWFAGHMDDLSSAICGHKLVEDLAKKDDALALVGALTPLLGFAPSQGAVAIIAALVVRIGVREICAGHWKA